MEVRRWPSALGPLFEEQLDRAGALSIREHGDILPPDVKRVAILRRDDERLRLGHGRFDLRDCPPLYIAGVRATNSAAAQGTPVPRLPDDFDDDSVRVDA